MSKSPQTFIGIPLQFKENYKVYPPKIKDVLENPDFNKFFSLLTISQEDIEDQIFSANDDISISEGTIPTPLQYLTKICQNPEYLNLVKEGFKFFVHEELTYIPEKEFFMIGNLEEILLQIKTVEDLPIINQEDFFNLQNLIRVSIGQEKIKPYDYNMHPKKRKMEAKKRMRDRVKAKQNSKSGSLENNLASICCMGIGLTPLNIGEMSYAAMQTLIAKYQKKEKYEIDMKILTSGFGSSKKIKPKYWMQEDND